MMNRYYSKQQLNIKFNDQFNPMRIFSAIIFLSALILLTFTNEVSAAFLKASQKVIYTYKTGDIMRNKQSCEKDCKSRMSGNACEVKNGEVLFIYSLKKSCRSYRLNSLAKSKQQEELQQKKINYSLKLDSLNKYRQKNNL
ncbi:UNKNOWN [Stylonychia lemnae]|uniref:Uncharacterized protein n=1 Tax=Stylonychia lemnae TaxID=5949 RepID=A0A078AA60_STYLE|nr:UNKNOWN [Stylonychia lemnae]|eukprot:CDW78771.1 UNKNOWN [Stylonychia lemnae]